MAFGGPTPGCCQKYNSDACPGEAYCFVEGIAGEAESQKERVKDISAHYVKLGGFSPFNELTFKQADALENRTASARSTTACLRWIQTLESLFKRSHRRNGTKRTPQNTRHYHGTAPIQSQLGMVPTGTVKKGIDAVDGEKPTIDYLDPWYTHKGYVGAISEIIETACGDKLEHAELVFTAHAIPQVAADTSPYTQQFEKTGEAVAKQIGKTRFGFAYQSEVENSPIPWTQPDINDWLKTQKEEGVDTVVASPIGFLCDHVEVLYDLDIEATETAETCGVDFIRAGTVGAHPKFINMLADFVCEKATKQKINLGLALLHW